MLLRDNEMGLLQVGDGHKYQIFIQSIWFIDYCLCVKTILANFIMKSYTKKLHKT